MTQEELFSVLCQAAGYAKLVYGVGNNAAHMAMLDGKDIQFIEPTINKED